MQDADQHEASWFQRFLLPGFAFKAVVIGGGYARETRSFDDRTFFKHLLVVRLAGGAPLQPSLGEA